METKHCDGNLLETGDAIKTIKDLEVRGARTTVKQGQTVKRIPAIDNPGELNCKVDGVSITRLTCFVSQQKDKKTR